MFSLFVGVYHPTKGGSNVTLVCSALFLGALMIINAAFRTYRSATIEFQVQRLAEQNEVYKTHNNRLMSSVTHLKQTTESLNGELIKFQKLRDSLEGYAEKENADISDAIQHLVGLHDNIKKLTAENERVLLERVVQDIEFLDNEQGITKREYERFLNRIPDHLKRGNEPRFTEMDLEMSESGQMVASYKTMQKVLDSILVGFV